MSDVNGEFSKVRGMTVVHYKHMPTRALIFDFDGLILETEASIFECIGEIYRDHGAELTLDIWHRVIGGTGGRFDVYDHLEQIAGVTLDRDALRSSVRAKHWAMVEELPVQDGVEDYLRDAKEMGLKLGVASSSSRQWVTGNLERLGLLHYFDDVRAGTDVQRTKPDPELYLASLERLGVQAGEALAFEDSPNGITAARAAGIFCVAVPNGITRSMQLDHADLRVESLADMPLAHLLARRHLVH